MSSKPTSANQPQGSASGSAITDASNPMSTVINGGTGRILCVSDIRGDYLHLNRMIQENKAVAVIHTGDFGFLDGGSPSRMLPRISRHLLNYTPLLDASTRSELLALPHGPDLFSRLDPSPSSPSSFKLSQLGLLLSGEIKLACPVYTVYGPVEDVRVLEKFRTGEYEVDNLMILDEALTRSLEVGGLKLRLFGLGGGVQMHRIFDNGEGTATIAGGNGTIWATALQIGELVDTAERVFDPSETRVLVTHGAYGRDGLLAQLAMVLKADLTISGALHFRFISSFNEFAVQTDQESFKNKLVKSKNAFMDVYESAKVQLDSSISADQKEFLQRAVQVAQKVPKADEEDPYWKNCWHWSLSEATYGHMVMSVKEGRVSAETFSQGLNFSYRRSQKAGRQTEAPAQTQTNPSQSNAQNKPVNPPSGPASQTRQPAQPRKVNPVETKPAPAQTSSTPVPTKPVTSATVPTVNPPTSNAAPAQAKPTPTAPSKHAENPIPSSTNSAPVPQQSQQQQQQSSQNQQQSSQQQQNGRPERKTSNRFEKAEAKDRDQRERAPERERESTWGKLNGAEPVERAGKKLRGPKPMKEGKETSPGSTSDGFKQVGSKRENAVKPETANKPDSDKENAGESSEIVGDVKKPEAEEGPSRINGEKPPRTPLNPYTLYIKGLPADVTQDSLKTVFDEAIRAKITRMKIPVNEMGKARHYAYVEFGNDEDLQAALNKHEDSLNGSQLNVSVSNPPTSSFRGGRGGFNGSRGGRGGFGRGGYKPGFNKSGPPPGFQ